MLVPSSLAECGRGGRKEAADFQPGFAFLCNSVALLECTVCLAGAETGFLRASSVVRSVGWNPMFAVICAVPQTIVRVCIYCMTGTYLNKHVFLH